MIKANQCMKALTLGCLMLIGYETGVKPDSKKAQDAFIALKFQAIKLFESETIKDPKTGIVITGCLLLQEIVNHIAAQLIICSDEYTWYERVNIAFHILEDQVFYMGHKEVATLLATDPTFTQGPMKAIADGFEIETNETPLMHAVALGKINIVQMLIAADANVNEQSGNDGMTALMIAVQKENPPIVAMLLQAGAEVNQLSSFGRSALDFAYQNGNEEIIQMLEDQGAKEMQPIRNGAMSALMLAAQQDHEEIVRQLLQESENDDDDDDDDISFDSESESDDIEFVDDYEEEKPSRKRKR